VFAVALVRAAAPHYLYVFFLSVCVTEREIERLMEAARVNRYSHRDATAILLAYRHGYVLEPGTESVEEKNRAALGSRLAAAWAERPQARSCDIAVHGVAFPARACRGTRTFAESMKDVASYCRGLRAHGFQDRVTISRTTYANFEAH
jgi:hypothetical protein